MGTSDYNGFLTQKSKKFYSDLSGLNSNKKINENIESLAEKILLKVSINKIKNGCSYKIKLFNINEKQKNPLNEFDNCSFQDNSKVVLNSPIIIEYYFEKEQPLLIEIIKIERGNTMKYEINTTLGCVMGSRNNTFERTISSTDNEILALKGEKFEKSEEVLNVKFEIRTHNYISYSDIKSKMYYEIFSNKILYRSECLNDEGIFDNVKIPVGLFKDNNLKIIFYKHTRKEVGNFKLSISEFINGEIYNVKTNGISYQIISKSQLTKNYTFVDYLKAGVQIGLSVAIDFTQSNGNPNDINSLHYIYGSIPNQYERAIYTCGHMVAYYDYDQLFPAFGFGAKINGTPTSIFNLNFKKDPNIHLIQGIIEAYHNAIEKVELSGPTLFGPIFKNFNNMIKKDINNFKYNILMILTDGIIDDIKETIDQLVEGSFLPLSVIIIGVGNTDFSKMSILDADENPLENSKGEKASRDLVQFVPFLKYENNPEKLANEVLAEIPKQVIEFYEQNNYLRINYLNIYK